MVFLDALCKLIMLTYLIRHKTEVKNFSIITGHSLSPPHIFASFLSQLNRLSADRCGQIEIALSLVMGTRGGVP